MDPRTAAAAAAAPRLLPHLLPHLLHLHVHLHLHPRLLFLLLLLLSGLFASDATSLGEFDTECYTANGEDYRGVQNRTASTASGKACLYWNETFQHPYNTVKYPNGEGGLGPHNYCRNPDGDVQPWCYIADHEDGIYWRYCDISTCQMPGNLGCFRDSGDPPALSGPSDTSNKLTIQNCISFCRKQRYKLAGMESGYACFCGNEVDQRSRADSPGTECNHVCFGDHTQPCGGDGWIIVFDTQVGSCGGNYTSSSGVLYSPDFPDRYGAGRACYWTVQVAGAAALLFHFSFFDLADQTDMVELLDGSGSPSGQVVARFDRRSPPPLREGEGSEVKVDGDFAIVYFYSDRTNQARGFSLRYRAVKGQDSTTIDEDEDEDDDDGDSKVDSDVSSTAGPQLSNRGSTSTTTSSSSQRSNGSTAERRSVLHVMTSSPRRPEQDTAVWSIYALAALLVLTVVALVAKLLLHVSIKTPTIPTVSGSFSSTSNSSSSSSSEPWIILYRPSTISLFKEKLRSHHSDLSPLVGN